MIGSKFNFEDIFMRDLTVGVLYTLEDKIKWRNRFSSGDVFVKVPIYYSLSGDERFLLDSFSDDIVSENRYVELNTDMIPRGHLTLTGFNIKSDEFANPNVWLKMVVENEWEIRKALTQVRAIPITVNYDLEILVSSEIDTFKCSQALMDTMWIYKFIYFEHNFMNIDAVITLPDSNTIQINREKNLTSDNKISVKLSFSVETYYPAWRSDNFSDVGYIIQSGDGMSDMNGYEGDGVVPWYMNNPGENNYSDADAGIGIYPIGFPYPPKPEPPVSPKPSIIPPSPVPEWPVLLTPKPTPEDPVTPIVPVNPINPVTPVSPDPVPPIPVTPEDPDNPTIGWPPPWWPMDPKPWPVSSSGTSGIGGSSGTTGTSGSSGTSGTNGVSGTSGASGTSVFTGENASNIPNKKTVIPKRSKWYDNILRAREEFRKR